MLFRRKPPFYAHFGCKLLITRKSMKKKDKSLIVYPMVVEGPCGYPQGCSPIPRAMAWSPWLRPRSYLLVAGTYQVFVMVFYDRSIGLPQFLLSGMIEMLLLVAASSMLSDKVGISHTIPGEWAGWDGQPVQCVHLPRVDFYEPLYGLPDTMDAVKSTRSKSYTTASTSSLPSIIILLIPICLFLLKL